MKNGFYDTLTRSAGPVLTILLVLYVAKRLRLGRHEFGLVWPSFAESLLWLALFAVVIVLQEVFSKLLGMPQPKPWGNRHSASVKTLRVLAMVVLAPVSEEIVFRGLLYHLLSRTAVRSTGAIVLTALLFTVVHFQYDFKALSFVFADGIFYGAARYATGSTLLTILLHSLGNAFAAYQRASGQGALLGPRI